MKKAVFPLLSLAFIISCAIFVYLAREAEPVYVSIVDEQLTIDNGQLTIDSSPEPPAVPALININTADLEELMTLQGVGPAIGQRIIDFREENGFFMAAEELMEVSGIGESVFGNIRELITVD
jgi:competence protein ComEA